MKKSLFMIAFISINTMPSLAQIDNDQYAKESSLELGYIPKSIIGDINLGKGYDMTDPWYPVVADQSPFFTVNKLISSEIKTLSKKTFIPKISEQSTPGSNEYHMSYQENVEERTAAQFFHAELKLGGLSWSLETSADYVKNHYNLSQAVRFVIENNSTFSNPVQINTNWVNPPITENSRLDDKTKWKLFKQTYGTHYVTSLTYGYRIEIIAFGNTSISNSKTNLNAAFNAWIASGKFSSEVSDQIKSSGANIEIRIFCKQIQNKTTGSVLPFVIRGIPDVLIFLDQLKNGEVEITPAPLTMSLKSYFASVCAKYENSCKMWENKIPEVDSNAVPVGTILAWVPPSQNIKQIAGQTIIIPPVGGWKICDKRTHDLDPRIPDLTDKFLMSINKQTEIGETGGSNTKSFNTTTTDVTYSQDNYNAGCCGNNTQKSPGLVHRHQVNFGDIDMRPMYFKVVYIIKTQQN